VTATSGIQPQLWVADTAAAIEFYAAALGATTLFRIGDGPDGVAQLAVGDASFWVATEDAALGRFQPAGRDGATCRLLLVVDDPVSVVAAAVAAGATRLSAVADEHVWRLGRVVDPFGHEWEIGHPLADWPPAES
jgi:PhnB protein